MRGEDDDLEDWAHELLGPSSEELLCQLEELRPNCEETLSYILRRVEEIPDQRRRVQYFVGALSRIADADIAKPPKRKRLPAALVREYRAKLSKYRLKSEVKRILANARRARLPERYLAGALRNARADSRYRG